MGTHGFTSIGVRSKFFRSNVRGTFLGGSGVGSEVASAFGSFVGLASAVAGAVGGISTDGAAGASEPEHAERRAHRQTAVTIDLTGDRSANMRSYAIRGN
jgi:hypothetical protein